MSKINPEEIFKHVEVLSIKPGEEGINVIKSGMLNNFYLNTGCDDFDDLDVEDHVKQHKEYHEALYRYGTVFSWNGIAPEKLKDYNFGCIFRAFGEDGFENVYMVIANDKENFLWIPVAKTNTPMCEVHRWIGNLNGVKAQTSKWMSIGYFRLEDIAEIMEENARDGHFYKITTVNGSPLDVLNEDDDFIDQVVEELEGVYQAKFVDGEMRFLSAAFILDNERYYSGLNDEWREFITNIVGEDPYDEDVDVDEEEDNTEEPVIEPGEDTDGDAVYKKPDNVIQLDENGEPEKFDTDGEPEKTKIIENVFNYMKEHEEEVAESLEESDADKTKKELDELNSQLDSLFK